MLRVAALAVILAAVAGAARAAGTPTPALSAARMCGGAYQDRYGACLVDQRDRIPAYPEIRCSVRVDAPRPALFTARLFYEGQLQRSYRRVLQGHRGRAISISFPGLRDVGIPGGRYRCDFELGRAHASVTGVSRGSTAMVLGASACPVFGTGARICAETQPIVLSDPRSLACSVVVVGMRGRVAQTELQRLEGSTWATLYTARDTIAVPIAEVWAYTTAAGQGPFPSGDYRCRFSVGGSVVKNKTFTVQST